MGSEPSEPPNQPAEKGAIRDKISSFDYNNPLGVSAPLFWIVRIYTPFLSVSIPLLAGFAIWVFKAKFLRDLVCEPIFTQLFALNIVLAVVGPGYTWVFQECSYYLTTEHGHSCNLLLWMHNFVLIASPWTFVLLLLERVVSINRQDDTWVRFKVMSTKASVCLLVLILPISIIGVLCSDVTGSDIQLTYPVCNPWWQNEYTSAGPVWFKVVAILFSLAPGVAVSAGMVLLAQVTSKYRKLVRGTQDNLDYYTGLYLGLRARSHLKFVTSSLWLGGLFIVTVYPLGIFILVGPAVEASRLHGSESVPSEPESAPNVTSAYKSSALDDSYLLLAQTDVEVAMWLLCYTWWLLMVPVLVLAEVLFRRECKGRILKLQRCLRCKRHPTEAMSNIGQLWAQGGEADHTHDEIVYVTSLGTSNNVDNDQFQHRCILNCRQGCCPCVDPRTTCSQQCSPPMAGRAGGQCAAGNGLRRIEDAHQRGAQCRDVPLQFY